MRIKLGLALSLLAITFSTVAYGDIAGDVIKMRQRVMQTNGQAARVAIQMVRGDVPFDPTVARAVLLSIAHDNDVFPMLFPDSTKTGETKAGAAIWEDAAGFEALSKKMVVDATAAADAAAQGLDAFKAAMGPVGQNCQACHQKYRQS